MRRFSIVGMMSFVLVCSICLAALRNANELWAGILLLLTLTMLGISLLGIFYLRGEDRAWWLGYSLFGGGYMLLAFGPWFREQVGPSLGTTQVVNLVYCKVTESTLAPGTVSSDVEKLQAEYEASRARLANIQRIVRSKSDPSIKSAQGRVASFGNQLNQVMGYPIVTTPSSAGSPTKTPPTRLQALFPGAAAYMPFLKVAHCVSALSAGFVGSVVSCHFFSRRERALQGSAIVTHE
jgi:hypothetical protein